VQLSVRRVHRRNLELAREIERRHLAEDAARQHLFTLAHVGRLTTAGELTASLAHELGQPLTAIVASAEATRLTLAAPSPDRARVDEMLASISQQGRRASEVIRALRRFLGRGAPQFVILDVTAVVRDVMELASGTIAKDRVQLALELSDDLPAVRGERVPLQQVVMNLAVNAVEAMRERPHDERVLTIRTSHTPQQVRVSVADTGPGIDPDNVQALFEPFRTTKADGLGMGLAICRSIVEAHGGRLRARNRRRRGAVFSFTLPVTGSSELRGDA
jgi:C4-dicarboxylate-specific signal transduction histidine kinase